MVSKGEEYRPGREGTAGRGSSVQKRSGNYSRKKRKAEKRKNPSLFLASCFLDSRGRLQNRGRRKEAESELRKTAKKFGQEYKVKEEEMILSHFHWRGSQHRDGVEKRLVKYFFLLLRRGRADGRFIKKKKK